MRYLAIVTLCVFGLAGAVHAAAPAVTGKERVLAQLLAGKWVENQYFTYADFDWIVVVTFRSSPLILDGGYSDSIKDCDKSLVLRTHYDFRGRESNTETVQLDPGDCWALVRYVEAFHAKYKRYPAGVDESAILGEKAMHD